MESNIKGLGQQKVGFWQLVGATMAGIFLLGYVMFTSGAFMEYGGYAAIYVGILSFLIVLLVSLPIMEYTRIAPFSGGYYGLSELGLGKGFGKYTSLLNYFFYVCWQIGNSVEIPEILVVGIYLIYGVLLPVWVFAILAIITATIMFFGASRDVRSLTKYVLYSGVAAIPIVLGFSIYVIAKTPYNTVKALNLFAAPGGFSGIALGIAISGFLTFVGYGTSLFYTEETKNAKKVTWRAIYTGMLLIVIIGSIGIYSQIAAVKNISPLTTAAVPIIVAYGPYIGILGEFFLILIFVAFLWIALAAGAGAQARLLFAMSRDGFIKMKSLSDINDKTKAPRNAALFNYILTIIGIAVLMPVILITYGYNINSIFYLPFTIFTMGTIMWYFHHFIPDISLYFYLRKRGTSINLRLILTSIVAPAAGVVIFSIVFYYGIISNLVEPYLAFVIAGLIVAFLSGLYVVYKAKRNELGDSVVAYLAEEKGD